MLEVRSLSEFKRKATGDYNNISVISFTFGVSIFINGNISLSISNSKPSLESLDPALETEIGSKTTDNLYLLMYSIMMSMVLQLVAV